jgi:hypothetical protein
MSPLNSYFLQGSPSEQRLVQDIINEQLAMYGQDVLYMPRKIINEKKIIKEVIVSKFDDSFRMEAYISTFDGFGGNGDILSKFGVRSTDEITFIVSKERYEDFITPKLGLFRDPNVKLKNRPEEGDLIYLPLDNALFEIKYVEAKTPFYQLNNLYVYELRCELFEYEDEIIDTGIDDVDESIKDFGYIATVNLVGSATSAASLSVGLATNLAPGVSGQSVYLIDILNGGSGYKSPPIVDISNPVSTGVTATAISILDRGSIDKIFITNPGMGYTEAPKVTLISNSQYGSGAIATAIIKDGVLAPIQIDSSGIGYGSTPSITVGSPPGIGIAVTAIAVPIVDSSGSITAVRYESAGYGYTASPSVDITSPANVSTGDYEFNELIRGVSTGTSAYVKDWDAPSRILKVSIINGNFAIGETIVGAAASYSVLSINKDNLDDPYAENFEIETEADKIIDFSERNPFGEI